MIVDLKKKYLKATENKRIGGSELLEELANEALEILRKAPSKQILPLFVLSKIFYDISSDQEQRGVKPEEAEQIYNKLDKGIKKLLENLEADEKEEILSQNTVDLIKSNYL